MDRAVLDGYFGPRLRERGIAIPVLHGASNSGRILDAALTQYTRAEVAVWLDKISPEFRSRSATDRRPRKRCAEKTTSERTSRG